MQQYYSLRRLHQQVLIIAIIYDIEIFIFIHVVLNVLAGITGRGEGRRKPHMKEIQVYKAQNSFLKMPKFSFYLLI